MLLLPRGDDASSLAIAQSLAMAVGFVVLIGFAQANAPQWPRLRDLALTSLRLRRHGGAGRAACARCTPGLGLIAAQMALAGGFYAWSSRPSTSPACAAHLSKKQGRSWPGSAERVVYSSFFYHYDLANQNNKQIFSVKF